MNARPATEPPRVLVAEPDRATRQGLRLVLAAAGFAVEEAAVDAATAVSLAVEGRPDLALMAAELPGGCMEAMRRITSEVPRTRLIVLTGNPSGDELVEAVLAGAAGYLSRDTATERLPEILRAVLAGEVALPRRYSQHLLQALRGRDTRRSSLATHTDAALTDREWQVLELLADEMPTGEIARRLGISVVTARRHISSLVAKLGVPDRAGAVELMRHRSRG